MRASSRLASTFGLILISSAHPDTAASGKFRAQMADFNPSIVNALRQQKGPPLLDQIRSHILAMSKTVLPKSAAGQGCSYALAIWTRLTRFLDFRNWN
jgi:hypothetical protein